jgi:hypothetical protein
MHRPVRSEHPMRFLKIPGKLADAEADARTILGEVVTELVAGRHQLTHELLPTLNSARDQEEGGSGSMALQLGQDQRGCAGIGAIIQRQGDHGGLQAANSVETALMKDRQPVE